MGLLSNRRTKNEVGLNFVDRTEWIETASNQAITYTHGVLLIFMPITVEMRLITKIEDIRDYRKKI
ncbi:hypothetical protein RJ640_002263 [Escallonia rubra]|uniref:Uncharacterized protein n=1 Tax=Escallonia rubra TaxID=112253 RepID=A0AA88QZQ5_9ASTE|nr:hypothetical protein RJ640_002263 [Escallonia rubra]